MALTEKEKQDIAMLKAVGATNEFPKYTTIPENANLTDSEKEKIRDDNLKREVKYELLDTITEKFQSDDSFTISTNDIEELDIFFKTYGNNIKHEEPFAHINLHSASNSEPIFALGAPFMLDAVNGVKMYAGKIIINALTCQTPLVDLCSKYGVNDIYDLPKLDLYLIPKNVKEKYLTKYSGIIIKNVKFKDWFLDRGTENPGAFFVMTYTASTMIIANTNNKKYNNLMMKVSDPYTHIFSVNNFDGYLSDFNTYSNIPGLSNYKTLLTFMNEKKNQTDEYKKTFLSACPNIYNAILKHIATQ